jgi:ankyrin repeat protein
MSTAKQLLEAVYDRADYKALRLYIKKDYDVRVQIQQQKSLLHVVASFTCSDCDKGSMVTDLIRRGAEVDARDDEGHTPLMVCKTKTVATALLDHGAGVNAVNLLHGSFTSLMYAVQDNNLPVVQLLLRRGAATDAVCEESISGLDFACQKGCLDMVKALLAAGAAVGGGAGMSIHMVLADSMPAKSAQIRLQLIKLLLEHGADVDAQDGKGQTPLTLAAWEGSLKLARVYLAAGASVNAACTQWHKTALHYATDLCDLEMVKPLLDNGADATASNLYKELPLHGACRAGALEAGLIAKFFKRLLSTHTLLSCCLIR